MKQSHDVFLSFSDDELAYLIANSKPPIGIAVSEPQMLIQCAAPGEVLTQIVISFAVGIPSSLVAAWIYDCLKNGSKKNSRVNHNEIKFSDASIRRLIDKELANQKARDAQWAKDHKKPRKKHR